MQNGNMDWETNIPVWELNLGVESEGMMKQLRQKTPCVERRFMWGEAQRCHGYLSGGRKDGKRQGKFSLVFKRAGSYRVGKGIQARAHPLTRGLWYVLQVGAARELGALFARGRGNEK